MAIVPRGENTFLVRVYLGRHPITGRRAEVNETVHGTYDDAVRHEQLLKSKADKGEFIKPSQMNVSQLIGFYLKSTRRRRRQSSQYQAKEELGRYVIPFIGKRAIAKIKPSEIEGLFNFLLDPKKGEFKEGRDDDVSFGLGLAVNTVRKVRDGLNAAFNFAVRDKLIPDNPVRLTSIPPPPLSTANPLTFKEVCAFISVKDHFWHGNTFVFNLHTGLRPEELMALVWDDVDFEKGVLRIERACMWVGGHFVGFGPTKNRASNRVIELAPQQIDFLRLHRDNQRRYIEKKKESGIWQGEPKLAEWLQKNRANRLQQYKNTELIFPGRHGYVTSSDASRRGFKSMLRRAGLTGVRMGVRWYDLRHTHATFLLILGIPPHEVAARLGHSVKVLNEKYAHVLEGRQRTASTLFSKLVPFDISGLISQTKIEAHIKTVINTAKDELAMSLLDMWLK
jgi:integrase